MFTTEMIRQVKTDFKIVNLCPFNFLFNLGKIHIHGKSNCTGKPERRGW